MSRSQTGEPVPLLAGPPCPAGQQAQHRPFRRALGGQLAELAGLASYPCRRPAIAVRLAPGTPGSGDVAAPAGTAHRRSGHRNKITRAARGLGL
ncbi:MAG: hypothetical protein ACHP9Z_30555, partial [Streptosporangiales bacterium]